MPRASISGISRALDIVRDGSTLPDVRKVLAAIALVALFLVADVSLLVYLGTLVGFWPTLGALIVAATLGAWLASREGLRVLDEARDSLASGRLPEEGLTGGLLVLAGGALLVMPGVLSDVAGILLLVPPSRRWIATRLRNAFSRWWQRRTSTPAAVPGADGSVAAEVVDFGDHGEPAGRGGPQPFFAVWSFTSHGGPFSGARGGPRRSSPDVIDVEAEEILPNDVVPPTRRLPG